MLFYSGGVKYLLQDCFLVGCLVDQAVVQTCFIGKTVLQGSQESLFVLIRFNRGWSATNNHYLTSWRPLKNIALNKHHCPLVWKWYSWSEVFVSKILFTQLELGARSIFWSIIKKKLWILESEQEDDAVVLAADDMQLYQNKKKCPVCLLDPIKMELQCKTDRIAIRKQISGQGTKNTNSVKCILI